MTTEKADSVEVVKEDDEQSANKFDHIPEPPLIRMETPGLDDQEYLFVQYDALDNFHDPIVKDFSKYFAVKCPICGQVEGDWGIHKGTARSDLDMHISWDHVGKKALRVFVEKRLDYDDPDPIEWVNQFVGKRGEVVSMDVVSGVGMQKKMSLEIEIGSFTGTADNKRLARYIPKHLDLDMVYESNMDVSVEYTSPRDPNPKERMKAAKEESEGWLL